MFKQKLANQNCRAVIIMEILIEQVKDGFWKNNDTASPIKMRGKRSFDVSTVKGIRKLAKYLYLEEFPNRKERKPKCLINEWSRCDESGESEVYVGIFKKTPGTMEAVSYYIDLEADTNHYDYSPTGKWFGSEADIIELEDRIIVTKSYHLDY